MFKEKLENLRKNGALIHNITNYVTVNDVANILLASGAAPIMADEIDEAADITSICGGLAINIGTLNRRTIPAMFAAGKKANELRHMVVLDPVGAGASPLRTETATGLLHEIRFTAIRGNISEIKAIAAGTSGTQGVDANVADKVTDENLENAVSFVKSFSRETGALIIATGAIDLVADKDTAYVIRNGHPDMSRITGTGCMLSALVAAYLTANPDDLLTAAAAAVVAMGFAGETARARMTEKDGNGAFRQYLLDAVYAMTGEALEAGAKYALR